MPLRASPTFSGVHPPASGVPRPAAAIPRLPRSRGTLRAFLLPPRAVPRPLFSRPPLRVSLRVAPHPDSILPRSRGTALFFTPRTAARCGPSLTAQSPGMERSKRTDGNASPPVRPLHSPASGARRAPRSILPPPAPGVRPARTLYGRYPATPFPRFSLPPRSGRPLVSCRISSKIFFNMTGKATFFKCAAISNCYLTSSFPPASGVPLPRPCPRRASSCRGSRRAAPDGLFRPPLPAFSQRIGAPFASLPHKKAAGTGRSKKGGPDRLRS